MPWSFINAIIEPVKVIAPIIHPNPISVRDTKLIVIPNISGKKKVLTETQTADKPTRLWKAATSWGRDFIFILLVISEPIKTPIRMLIIINI